MTTAQSKNTRSNNWGGARPGAGRKPNPNGTPAVVLSIYMPESLAQMVRKRASQSNMSVSAWVCKWLQRGL